MKHSALARMIAGNNRPANDDQPTRQKPDTAYDVDNGPAAASAGVVERTTTDNDDGPQAANVDA